MQSASNADDRGASLRGRREAAGLSRARLAGYAECGVTVIENIEAGLRPKSSPTLARIYAVLDEIERINDSREEA